MIQQVKQDFLIMDAETTLLMKVILKSATGGGLCSRGLKQLIWQVFLANDLTVTVGNVGRNGNKLEEVTLGQPRAFYFKSLPSDQIPEGSQSIDSTHKLLLASLLVGLMVTCTVINPSNATASASHPQFLTYLIFHFHFRFGPAVVVLQVCKFIGSSHSLLFILGQ